MLHLVDVTARPAHCASGVCIYSYSQYGGAGREHKRLRFDWRKQYRGVTLLRYGCPSGQQCSVQLQYVPATWDSCLGANLVAVQGAPADSNAAFNCNMCLPPGILVWGLTYGPVCPQALVATMPTVITTSKLVGQAVRHKMHVDIAISLLLLAGP